MNKKQHLITNSLLGAVQWHDTAPETQVPIEQTEGEIITWKEKAFDDLRSMLQRKPFEMSVEAQQGIDFESSVFEYARKPPRTEASEHFQHMVNSVRDMNFQQIKKKSEMIGGYNCLLYCKIDAIAKNNSYVVDLKTTKKYEKGKYLDTAQHLLYCHITRINSFDYMIAEWEEYPKIKTVHIEQFDVFENSNLGNWGRLEILLHAKILNCFQRLHELELWDDYRVRYCKF